MFFKSARNFSILSFRFILAESSVFLPRSSLKLLDMTIKLSLNKIEFVSKSVR